MKHNHSHACSCSHSSVKYCSHCRTVYCENCNQEWTAKTQWYSPYNWSYTLGNGQYSDFTKGIQTTGYVQTADNNTGYCKHNHE